jgi:site-specific recombinase XerD
MIKIHKSTPIRVGDIVLFKIKNKKQRLLFRKRKISPYHKVFTVIGIKRNKYRVILVGQDYISHYIKFRYHKNANAFKLNSKEAAIYLL